MKGVLSRQAAGRIDLNNPVHVAGKIHHNRDIATLTGQRRASATAKQRRTEIAARGYRRQHDLRVVWKNYSDRNLAVVGSIGGVQGAAARVKADIVTRSAIPALQRAPQCLFQSSGVGRRRRRRRGSDSVCHGPEASSTSCSRS